VIIQPTANIMCCRILDAVILQVLQVPGHYCCTASPCLQLAPFCEEHSEKRESTSVTGFPRWNFEHRLCIDCFGRMVFSGMYMFVSSVLEFRP